MVTLLLNSWTGGHFKIWIFSRTSYLYKNDSKKQTKFDFLLCSRNIIWDDCREFHNVLRLYGHLKHARISLAILVCTSAFFLRFFLAYGSSKLWKHFKNGTMPEERTATESEEMKMYRTFYTRTCLLTSTLIDALEEGRNQWYKRLWCLYL